MSNKFAIAIVIILILGGLGYFVYQYLLPSEFIPLNPENEFQNNPQNNSNNSTNTAENNTNTTTEPTIKIISPNGTENWKIGSTYEITWNASGVESVDIILENWDKVDGSWPASILISRNVAASLGKYSFLLSSDKLPPQAEKSGNHFKIRIVSYPLDYTISDRSDDFFSIQ